ncbi:MAG: FAD-dependent oxidoreductase [Bryobacterales bacterium]|nr:FAD-dependent oxidoreductase [Bryobacterales bacterium]
MPTGSRAEVTVAGAGVFGAWIAWHLHHAGLRVALVDAYGPANSRASSGGESRILRMAYGAREHYTRWSVRSLQLWREFAALSGEEIFVPCGALWLHPPDDVFAAQTVKAFQAHGVRYEAMAPDVLAERFPQFAARGSHAVYEPHAGALLARRSVQALVRWLAANGVRYEQRRVNPRELDGETVVYACGPWLPRLFPELLGNRIVATRQEVLFFGVPPGSSSFGPQSMPCWVDVESQYYGIPDLESRGFKIAHDVRGVAIDPDTENRSVSREAVEKVRDYLAARFPALAGAPLVETRVCQYENTSNGDYLLDRHPDKERVWLAGGGSGHGFKHGPMAGKYMAGQIMGSMPVDARFGLAAKLDCSDGAASSSL